MSEPDFEVAARSLNDALWQLAAKGSSGRSADKAMDKADIIAVEALQAAYQLGQQSQWRTDIDAMEFYTHYAVAIGGKVYSPCRRSLTKDNAIDIYQDGASDIVVDFSKIRAFYEVTPPKEGE